jgi:hypothetical protein
LTEPVFNPAKAPFNPAEPVFNPAKASLNPAKPLFNSAKQGLDILKDFQDKIARIARIVGRSSIIPFPFADGIFFG